MANRIGPSWGNALEKKVPRNPKYANVRGSIDTGNSASKLKTLSTKEFIKRQAEIFARVRAKELMELLSSDSIREEEEDSYFGMQQSLGNNQRKSTRSQQESSLGLRGPIGDHEKDAREDMENAEKERQVEMSRDVLILDLRDLSEYNQCHLQSAVSYPLININQDRITTGMFRFKNKEGRLIVVYDEDERIAALGAAALVQRGFENVRMLSGGLKTFGNLFPHMLSADLPDHLVREKSVSPTSSSVSSRREERRRRAEHSPRDTYSSNASGFSLSSTLSHKSTFSRAPRWNEDRPSAQRHKELIARMHHAPGQSEM